MVRRPRARPPGGGALRDRGGHPVPAAGRDRRPERRPVCAHRASAEAILIVEITVRLRRAGELARHDAASAEVARREASFGLQMREELLTFLSTKIQGPLTGMVDGLISARSAVERGESARAMAALDGLAGEVRVLQRTTEHWLAEAGPTAEDR